MGQRVMGKPTKRKRSAEGDETPEALRARLPEIAGIDPSDELRARIFSLAADYQAEFRRKPTKGNLDMAELLLAILQPERREQLANELRQRRNEDAGTSHKYWRKVWFKLVPVLVATHDGEPQAVARDLIRSMPAELRAACPGYPANNAKLEEAVAAVVRARNFERQVVVEWRSDSGLDPSEVARAVLRGCGMTKADANSLLRKKDCEPWVREHTATKPAKK